jgi:hypothetical protein
MIVSPVHVAGCPVGNEPLVAPLEGAEHCPFEQEMVHVSDVTTLHWQSPATHSGTENSFTSLPAQALPTMQSDLVTHVANVMSVSQRTLFPPTKTQPEGHV